jgi:hypothetical protein
MLIGLTGAAGCGKTTVAKMLNIPMYNFAQPMKESCRIIFGWNDEHLHGDLKEIIDPNFGVSPRQALQTMGTDWGRNMITKDLWLKRAQIEINKHAELVIGDVRMNNEAELIKQNGGIIVHIVRGFKQEVRAHVSEEGVADRLIDITLGNDGSLEHLRAAVKELKQY